MFESDNLFAREIAFTRYNNGIMKATTKRVIQQDSLTSDKDDAPREKKIKLDQSISYQQYEHVRNTFTNIAKDFISKHQVGTLKNLQLKFEEDYHDFSCSQKLQNIEDGDKVLKAYINDMKLTASQCKKLFGIGPSRYNRIKSDTCKKIGSMQSPKEYHEIKLAIFNVFIKVVMQCLSDNNISCLLDFDGYFLIVKPKIHDWKSKKDVWKNYCLFHEEADIYFQVGYPYCERTFVTKLNACKEILNKLGENNVKNSDTAPTETLLPCYQPLNPNISSSLQLTVFYFNGIAVAIAVINAYLM